MIKNRINSFLYLFYLTLSLLGTRPVSAQGFGWPPLQNGYCPIQTFVNNNIPARAFATMLQGPNGPIPVIFISTAFVGNPPLLRFAMAHECGHHMTGQIIFNATNPFAALPYAAQEYQADCWAAQMLRSQGDIPAIYAALADAGAMPTMSLPNRTQNIRQCAGV